MKNKERDCARRLRGNGWSVRSIANKIKCSKSTISNWVRDIPLTDEQIEKLKSNQDRGRAKAANHRNAPKQVWAKIRARAFESAQREIHRKHSLYALKIVGAALYWGEGYKSGRCTVSFSNSDPGMIVLIMEFFRKICKVSEDKFRGALHIHPHLDVDKAKRYWSKISGIPIKQFHKSQISVSKASKNKKDSLPFGTFSIYISDTLLRAKIDGWIKGVEKW
ncbi:MAG: helix-turn-helix domain-containing protein [Candidatus Omnitrophota bacterium]|jgi:transcriptional regulator with XRE-family HTH domain